MRIVTLLAVPCAIALLLGGVLLWPAAPTAQVARQQGVPAASNHHHDPVQEAADELQERYRTFISAQSSLTVPTDITLASLQILFDEREQLRQQSFTPAEQERLFAEDRLMEQWTLRRKALAEASDADKQELASELELWLAAQPRWFQEAEANGRLLGELQALEQMEPARRDAMLLEKAGPEAVDRLHQLEQDRQGFKEQLNGYLAELGQLPASARTEQQQELLARWFEPQQWRRVEALTRMKLGE
ncbi:lipase chaperone [Aeromonas jandaei]|uniref:Lipase chaperone n=1 Tax=Aeromonas jandaei TaxID=650 RepID=A0A7T4DM54_AERJA|nr:lipase secretion chaperone [Aeromonas jandaei]QQB18322.1 lipase chaperone [Aeromonas jandaei]UCA32992.1 lipase chaperone [Aeromonas jandaei]